MTHENKDFAIRVGDRVRLWRMAAGWSQYRLAEEAGIDRKTAWQIENPPCNPSAYVLKRICDALHAPYEDIFDE